LSVEAVEFVTADGRLTKASATEHQDLYWAARGCGPGMFAVAVRFHLKCYSLPKSIATSNYCFSLNDLQEVVDEVVAAGRRMPSTVELSIFLKHAPAELAAACGDRNGKLCMISAVAFGMTGEESQAALAPLDECAIIKKALARSFNQLSSFEQLAIASGETWPENHRNLCENQCSKARPSDILMAMRDKILRQRQAVGIFPQLESDRLGPCSGARRGNLRVRRGHLVASRIRPVAGQNDKQERRVRVARPVRPPQVLDKPRRIDFGFARDDELAVERLGGPQKLVVVGEGHQHLFKFVGRHRTAVQLRPLLRENEDRRWLDLVGTDKLRRARPDQQLHFLRAGRRILIRCRFGRANSRRPATEARHNHGRDEGDSVSRDHRP